MKTIDWKNATPEQINLWKKVEPLLVLGLITPLYYQGPIAGSEFLTYDEEKLYLALEFDACYNTPTSVGGAGLILFHDEANVINFHLQNNHPVWDTAAVEYCITNVSIKNIYFSRIETINFDYMKFNGYKIEP